MSRMKKIREKISYRMVKKCVVILLALCLALSLGRYFSEIRSLTSVELDEEGIRNPAEGEGSGLYELTDRILIRKGYYEYTVAYTADGAEGSFVWPFAAADDYNSFEQVPVYLENGTCTVTDQMWVNADLHIFLRLYYTGTGTVSVSSFSMKATGAQARKDLFFALLFCVAVCFGLTVYEYRRKNPDKREGAFVPAALIATVVLCSFPAFFTSVGMGNDTGFHLTRIQGIAEGLRAGQFPVRINPTFYNGYGYADPEYYGNLLLYVPALLTMVGFRLSSAYNIFIVWINLLTVLFAYYAFRKIAGDRYVALAGAFLYAMSPYRIACIYYRSAVGEYSAMAFLPFVVYGLWRIFATDEKKKNYNLSFVPVVVGLSGLIQTHLLSCEMVGGVILFFCVLLIGRVFRLRRFLQLALSVIVTALVNLWFLLPFADSMLNQVVKINVMGTGLNKIQRTGLFFSQLFTVFPQFSLITTDASEDLFYKNEMPLVLGIVYLLAIPLFIGACRCRQEDLPVKKAGMLVLPAGILTTWMSTVYFPWDRISGMNPLFHTLITSLQFVWRFLGAATILMNLLVVLALWLIKRREESSFRLAAAALCLVAAVTPLQLMENAIQHQEYRVLNNISDIGYNTASTVSNAEYSLAGSSWDVINTVSEPRTFGEVKISGWRKNGTTADFCVEEPGKDGYVLLPLLAYRGYSVRGETPEINAELLYSGDHSVLRVNIPDAYVGKVHVYFKGFWYWRAAEIISLLSLAGVIFFVVHENRRTTGGRAGARRSGT